MHLDVNQTILVGTLSEPPQLAYTANDTAMVKLRVSIKEPYRTKEGEQKESITTLTVIIWGSRGEDFAQTVGQGSRVFIKGKIENRSFKDNFGAQKWITQINANTFFALDITAPQTTGYQTPSEQIRNRVDAVQANPSTNGNALHQLQPVPSTPTPASIETSSSSPVSTEPQDDLPF